MIDFSKLINSFRFALAGLKNVFQEEQNFRIHLGITIVVLLLALYLQAVAWQIVILILLIAIVLILEIVNSILERIIDLLKPRIHQYAKDIKDMTAAIVLVAATAAFLGGLIIFIPLLQSKFF